MMNKLEMAHQYFMQTMGFIRNNNIDHNFDDVVSEAWDYVDAMQAEADKRKTGDAKQKLTGGRALQQTFIDGIEQPRYSDEQWQPDWSQAPEWAKYWAADKDLSPFWHEDKPKFDDVEFYQCGKFCAAPLFSYKGPWQDSVRKRP